MTPGHIIQLNPNSICFKSEKNKSECQKSLMMREHLEISNQNHLKYLKYRKQKKKLDNLTGKK